MPMTTQDITKLPYRPCVGVMLMNAEGAIFVGQRLDSKVSAWQMPQGGIEKGEDPKAAALRELWEETGIKPELVSVVAETQDWLRYELPFDLVPRLWKGRYRGQKQKWFLMQFSGQDSDINIETEHPEFSAWRWLESDNLVDNIVPFKRDVYSSVLSAFADQL